MSILRISCVLTLLFVSLNLYAKEVDVSLPATGVAQVNIDNLSGTVSVLGTDNAEVKVVGTLDKKSTGLVFEQHGDSINIRVKMPSSKRNSFWGNNDNKTKLHIALPKSMLVNFDGISSDVQLSTISNDVRVKVVSGNIKADQLEGKISLESVSGNIDSRTLSGRVSLTTVSGDIVDNASMGRLHYQAVSGDIEAQSSASEIIASVISGDLDIDLNDVEDAELSSVSGSLDASLSLLDDGHLDVSSVSGDIKLMFKQDINADIKIYSSASGRIINKLNSDNVKKSKYGPSSKLVTRVGKGGANVKGSTVSGDVHLKY